MKLSVSLSDADVAVLDAYADAAGLPTRSAAIQRAIMLLPNPELQAAYEAAWDEWVAGGDADAWDATVGDGMADAAW